MTLNQSHLYHLGTHQHWHSAGRSSIHFWTGERAKSCGQESWDCEVSKLDGSKVSVLRV